MALDMANSDERSTTVKVLVSFYLDATDYTSVSSARTWTIHREKFKFLLSSDEHKGLFNFVKHIKTFTGLGKIARSKGLGENPEVMIVISCSFIIRSF